MKRNYIRPVRVGLSVLLSLILGMSGMSMNAIAEVTTETSAVATNQQAEGQDSGSSVPNEDSDVQESDESSSILPETEDVSTSDDSETEDATVADEAETTTETTVVSEIADDDTPITRAQMLRALGQEPVAGDEQQQVTLGDAIDVVMASVNLQEDLPQYTADCNRGLAIDMGVIDYSTDLSTTCTGKQFLDLEEAVGTFKDAAHAEKKQPLFMNGMAQPIFPFTSGAVEDGYSNETSDTIRYSVWVETNYDTDGDGMQDMIKCVVQVPRAAARGDYEAATIYEARPYISGCTDIGSAADMASHEGFDMSKLHATGKTHSSSGKATTMEAAANATSDEWYYVSPYESSYDESGNLTDAFMDYESLDWYDYYLCRGYAVVEVAGLGTRGSDGFETCGSDVEIDAFKCVVEWLHGDRPGYTSRDGGSMIDADWSNGKVGMTGRSYGGTTDFGIAQTGVEGLETIVPVSGIASWYDYYNCQGTRTSDFPGDQLSSLAAYCAGRKIDPDDWSKIETSYGNYIHQLEDDTVAGGSDYSDVWRNRDYTVGNNNFRCSALVVHGLNDQNVTTKHFEMMYRTLKKAGCNTKLLLHQGAHLTPNVNNEYLIMIGDQSYDDILNRWFSHYLYDVDNGAEDMAEVTAQSNLDANVWNTYGSYTTNTKIELGTGSAKDSVNVSSDYAASNMTVEDPSDPESWRPFHEKAATTSTASNATFVTPEFDEDTTIKGTVSVNFDAAFAGTKGDAATPDGTTDDVASDNMPVTVMLMDVSDTDFGAYDSSSSRWGRVPVETTRESDYFMGCGLDIIDVDQFVQTPTKAKVIERGWVDLANPSSGFASDTAEDSIELVEGESHSYTVYLQPNVYTVAQGHHLALVIMPYDQEYVSHDGDYSFDLDVASVQASIPTDGTNAEMQATYLANNDTTTPDDGKTGDGETPTSRTIPVTPEIRVPVPAATPRARVPGTRQRAGRRLAPSSAPPIQPVLPAPSALAPAELRP